MNLFPYVDFRKDPERTTADYSELAIGVLPDRDMLSFTWITIPKPESVGAGVSFDVGTDPWVHVGITVWRFTLWLQVMTLRSGEE